MKIKRRSLLILIFWGYVFADLFMEQSLFNESIRFSASITYSFVCSCINYWNEFFVVVFFKLWQLAPLRCHVIPIHACTANVWSYTTEQMKSTSASVTEAGAVTCAIRNFQWMRSLLRSMQRGTTRDRQLQQQQQLPSSPKTRFDSMWRLC